MASSAADSGIVRFGPFELDLQNYELRKEGIPVHLPPQPCRVLALLASQPHRVISRQEIQQKIWSSDTFVDFEQGLNVCIRQIRAALADDAETPRYVETLSRRGYRFIAQVNEPLPDAGSSAIAKESDQPRDLQRPYAAWQPLWRRVAVGAAAVFAVAALAWEIGHHRVGAGEPHPPIRSLAVLPLTNLSNDPEQDYFADGMTEQLITDLGKISTLRVISRTSVIQYKGAKKPVPQIARELGVDTLLEGAVLRSGDRVRITAQLIDAATTATCGLKATNGTSTMS